MSSCCMCSWLHVYSGWRHVYSGGCMCIQVAACAEGLGFDSQLVPECPLLNRRVKKKVNL